MSDKINSRFKVNISGLSEFSGTLQLSIHNIIKEEGYINYVIRNNPDSANEHFLGEIFEVDINGDTADGTKKTSLLIKRKVVLEKIKLTDVNDVYARELFVYHDLSRVFNRLQIEAKVPENERFKFAKSYPSDSETIIMENLAKKGFKTYHRYHVIQKKFAELSIISLAKFHCLTFVIKKKLPNYFDEKIRAMKFPFNFDNDWSGYLSNICDVSADVLKGEIGEKVREYAPRLNFIIQNMLQVNKPKNGCLCHGDYKILNILVREQNGEPTEVYPIDYQLIYHGSPVNDFFFYMFTGTDQAFRRQHLNYLKELYFETLSNFMRFFELDVESTYSRVQYEKDYKERFELGLAFGLFMAGFTFVDIDDSFDLSKLCLSELPLVPGEVFESRIRGIVEDYIEWGYL